MCSVNLTLMELLGLYVIFFISLNNMRGSRIFCQRGSNFVFTLMREGRIKIPLLAGYQPLKWLFAGGPMIAKH